MFYTLHPQLLKAPPPPGFAVADTPNTALGDMLLHKNSDDLEVCVAPQPAVLDFPAFLNLILVYGYSFSPVWKATELLDAW